MQHNKIYTKRGDTGLSSIIGKTDLPKDSLVFNAIGNIDELNSILGLVKSLVKEEDIFQKIEFIQRDIFLISSEIVNLKNTRNISQVLELKEIEKLEQDIDKWESELPELTNFIIPGEDYISSNIHLARSICRRAERSIVSFRREENLRPEILSYFNRLSDWLFTLARIKSPTKDPIWTI